ncbi:unnamed protein product [Kuraishia capsulata CBS 1993]|uniref:Mannose-6-phosphate isomerase n=1 Tax=Kuraishia capsulata CBS 1993 TaxID=1382522 RepID=W6MUS3_9ASCO|nr:uncharacterized protein KUCA_T00001846001 [Kuraishia capsulata CBS 1993]CDK25875.1 unnamed protein product [Kuraishia capsulata CBS 1993]
MGTHPSVPSINPDTGKSLREIISADPEALLGDKIIEKFGSKEELPFLFKVLSIRKVLSIQAHPDKTLGAKLHASDPKNYPDANHKPEMAVAVTDFEAFCGFKPLKEIEHLLATIPEFHALIGDEISKKFSEGIKPDAVLGSADDVANRKLLQLVFGKLMNTDDATIAKSTDSLVARTKSEPELFGDVLADLIQRMDAQFPHDVGLFCGCIMLNHCTLKAGEAIFLQAKDPHAYISGDIMECMAASDNVIRAGFTPKFKDVEVLVDCLTYSYDDVEKQKMQAPGFSRSHGDGDSKLYDPPIAEFAVLQTTFDDSKGTRWFDAFEGPSVLITTEGKGFIQIKGDEATRLPAEAGYTFFIAPGAEIELISESDDKFTTYRAFVEA